MKPCLQSRDRKGQSLILIIFILIALIGVMALTLDFGFVLLARRQMQTGVNAAALEGLRGQGISEYDVNGEQPRREYARHILQLSYDDDFDLSANETTIGAGIDSSLIEGHEFQQTTIGSPDSTLKEVLDNRHEYIYRPDPQLNTANFVHGDMVVGQYVDPSDPDADQRPIAGRAHEEFSTYERTDFRTPQDADFDPGIGSRAFLVRMRRTHNPGGLDEDSDVSSSGGGLPLLLARAGWMRAEDDAADYSVRRDGVTVRATAIAQGESARTVGMYDEALTLAGAPRLSLEIGSWAIFPERVARPAQIDAAGNLFTLAAAHVSEVGTETITVPASDGFPDPDNNPDDYFDVQLNGERITVTDIDDNDSTLWSVTPPPSLMTDEDASDGDQLRADEREVGVRLTLSLLADVPDGSPDDEIEIQVQAGDDFIDPNRIAAAAFQIQIGVADGATLETLTVIDIDDDDSTVWTVQRGANSGPHALNEDVYVPRARSLMQDVSTADTQIVVQSVVSPIDPDAISSLSYEVKIDKEQFRVLDIRDDANGMPTLWTVERLGAPATHSSGAQVRPVTTGAVTRIARVGISGVEDAVTTEITVDTSKSDSSFPDPENVPRAMYLIRIGDEVLRVRDIDDDDDTTLIVDREVRGTASAHPPRTVVTWVEPLSIGDVTKRWAQFPLSDDTVRANLAPSSPVMGFIPIHETVSDSHRIVAFGPATIEISRSVWTDWGLAGSRGGILIEKQPSQVAVENATSRWPSKFARDQSLDDLSDVIDFIHSGHKRFGDAPLRAPALVRTIR